MKMNLPNKLTVLRLIMVPIFMAVMLIDFPYHYLISLNLFIAASLTDMIDGQMARKYNLVTNFGKFLDPIADKLTQFVCAALLVYTYPAYWVLLIIIVIKDVMLAVAGVYIFKKTGRKMDGAQLPGKIATAVFFVVSISLIAFHIPETLVSRVLILLTAFLMFTAMVYYAKDLYQLYVKRD